MINVGECAQIAQIEDLGCSQLLQIQYPKDSATVLFQPNSNEIFELSNAAQIMTNKTMIWLDKYQFERTFQILCFHANACTTDTINQTYVNGRSSN